MAERDDDLARPQRRRLAEQRRGRAQRGRAEQREVASRIACDEACVGLGAVGECDARAIARSWESTKDASAGVSCPRRLSRAVNSGHRSR